MYALLISDRMLWRLQEAFENIEEVVGRVTKV
jgi:hypothetical protein